MSTTPFPQIPGYRIEKQMGQGGMATVYLAVQESFGRPVALKVMSDQLGQDDVWARRFMHEARVVSQLSHSNIVPVFDVGQHEGRFYISMELLKGGKLDERMAKGLGVAEAVRVASGVAAGLDYAGAKGFVHRDIKPDNVMFRDDGTPVILDFGIAKQMDGDSKMTQTGTIVGTTGYMSPEQAMGQALDPRSDIYSLGIMLYELLTGAVPFRGDSAVAVLLKHVQEAPPPLPPSLSAFQPVLDRALAKKPDERYARASEMIQHLEQALANHQRGSTAAAAATTVMKPVSPREATQVQSPAQQAPRSRAPLWMALAVVAVASVAAVAYWLKSSSEAPAASVPAVEQAAEPVVAPAPASVPAPAPEPVPSPAPEPAPAVVQTTTAPQDSAATRILQGASACLQKQQYDCAKSKAESVLDLDPGNAEAQLIFDKASKAQKAAFDADWNAN